MENQKKENTDKPVPKKQSAGFLYEVRKENIRHGEAGPLSEFGGFLSLALA